MTQREKKKDTKRQRARSQRRYKVIQAEPRAAKRWGKLCPAPAPLPPLLHIPPTPPHLGVGGPVDHLSLPQPDDGGSRLGVVCMAGEVEGVPSPQADHRPPEDHRVVGRHCGGRERGEVRLRAPLLSGKAEWILWSR